jgi:RNA polymerase sigma-70 factor (ECF subfamily)
MKKLEKLTDEELIDLVRTQNQELYREVVRRFQDKLLRYAVYLIGDEAQTADVVQEAFIKAFINLQSFNLKKKFSSWIYRIVHNQAVNYLKKHSREISLDNNQWLEETIESGTNIEEEFDKKELRQMLNSCLQELPLKYRSALVLFYLEEKSYEEISDVLRMPVGTVGTRINRGKKLLAGICRRRGGEVYA